MLAVILGIALTYIIRPGRDTPFEHGSGGDCAQKNVETITSKMCGPLLRPAAWRIATSFVVVSCAYQALL